MAKVRINEWARQNKKKTADVMRQLKQNGVKVSRMTEKIEVSVLENMSNPKPKGAKSFSPEQIKKHKKKNYRRNLFNARVERDLLCLDDIFEELELDFQLTDEVKMAVGMNVKDKFKFKKGFNGSYLVNLYDLKDKPEIIELVKSLV